MPKNDPTKEAPPPRALLSEGEGTRRTDEAGGSDDSRRTHEAGEGVVDGVVVLRCCRARSLRNEGLRNALGPAGELHGACGAHFTRGADHASRCVHAEGDLSCRSCLELRGGGAQPDEGEGQLREEETQGIKRGSSGDSKKLLGERAGQNNVLRVSSPSFLSLSIFLIADLSICLFTFPSCLLTYLSV